MTHMQERFDRRSSVKTQERFDQRSLVKTHEYLEPFEDRNDISI